MNIVKPGYEIILPPIDSVDLEEYMDKTKRHIEHCGRICYKSENNISEDSHLKMYDRLVQSKHYAVLEHGTVYFKFPMDDEVALDCYDYIIDFWHERWNEVKPIIVTKDRNNFYVSTNVRYIKELGDKDKSKTFLTKVNNYLSLFDPEHHELRVSVKLITSLQVTHDMVRHRKMSYCMESTRYCNYSKDKFTNELTFIKLPYVDVECRHYDVTELLDMEEGPEKLFIRSCFEDERNYLYATTHYNWQPQLASCYVPKALKTEIMITGFLSDWAWIFSLRSLGITGAPRPDVLELAVPLHEDFMKYYHDYLDNKWAFMDSSQNSHIIIMNMLRHMDEKNGTDKYFEHYQDYIDDEE